MINLGDLNTIIHEIHEAENPTVQRVGEASCIFSLQAWVQHWKSLMPLRPIWHFLTGENPWEKMLFSD